MTVNPQLNNILTVINMMSALCIFVHCACRLSVKKWDKSSKTQCLRVLAYAMMLGGSIFAFATSSLFEIQYHPSSVMVNAGLALYFFMQTDRMRNLFDRNQK